AHPQGDGGFRLRPQCAGTDAVVRPRLHPTHRPVVARVEPSPEVDARRVGCVSSREAARHEAEPRRLRPYCFLKALVVMHRRVPTRCVRIFVGISVLRQVLPSSATEPFAVEAMDLVKDFGNTRAVDGVSLAVPTGSIYGLLGPNGAGKTTTLRMLIGIIDPSSGMRRVLGREQPIDAAPEIGYLPEERGLYQS